MEGLVALESHTLESHALESHALESHALKYRPHLKHKRHDDCLETKGRTGRLRISRTRIALIAHY